MAAGWQSPEVSGVWVQIERAFRDGHTEIWWALEVAMGPYAPKKPIRAVVATTDNKLPLIRDWRTSNDRPTT